MKTSSDILNTKSAMQIRFIYLVFRTVYLDILIVFINYLGRDARN